MKLPTLPRFTRAEIIFSLKCFAAAMLALYFASRLGLPRPFWALTTSYVVASPLAGTVRSKAIYRFLGTLLGCTATLLLVPALSNAPELLTLALALWVGLCLFVSLLDRTPRSYVFMLAGYTAALIGFPSVEAPQLLFDTATLRVEEIWIGILCATIVHSIVLPAGLAPSVLGLLDSTLGHTRRWLSDLLGPRRGAAAAPGALAADRRRVAADITQLRLLSTHVPFDTTHLRWTAGAIRAMQDRIAALMPALSAVEDRLLALEQAEGALAPDVVAALARIANWLEAEAKAAAPERRAQALQALRLEIRAFGLPATPVVSGWPSALRVGLAGRLDELVEGWDACLQLRDDIDTGLTGAAVPLRRTASLGHRALHRDIGMALWSAMAAVLAICLCSWFWIATAWPSGSAAVMMAAVFCCFFATMDDPVPAIRTFLKYIVWSVPISLVYVLVLLPPVQDFGMLAVVCAPSFLVLGCYMARPANFMAAMAIMTAGVSGTLGLHDTGTVDMLTFTNSMIGQVLGIVAAAGVTGLVRSVGTDWSARRIQRATWRELGTMAAGGAVATASHDAYAVRMLDRIGLLAPRIAASISAIEGVAANDALRDLRVGADLVSLQRMRVALAGTSIPGLLTDIERFFRDRAAGRVFERPAELLARIDGVLTRALAAPDEVPEWRPAVTAIVGLRRNLFPGAPPALAVSSEGVAAT